MFKKYIYYSLYIYIMSNSWLDYPTTSNLFKQSYIKDFLDVSGDVYIRNGNINGINSDISMNGTLTCNSLTLTESTGAGINSDVQTALDGKQDLLISGTGIDISNDTISLNSGANENITQTTTTNGGSISFIEHLNEEDYIDITLNNTGTGTFFGLDSVNISGDGNSIITGVRLIDIHPTTNQNAGGAVVIEFDGSNWVNKGDPIRGKIQSNIPYVGVVNISWDGNIIALGTKRTFSPDGGVTTYKGYIETFKYVNSSWVQIGQTFEHSDHYGYTINGDVLEFANNGLTITFNAGGVIVYDYDEQSNLWVSRGPTISTSTHIDITEDGNTISTKWNS